MKPEEIRELIKLVEESDINELEVSRWWKKVKIRKKVSNANLQDEPNMTPKKINSERNEFSEEVIKEKTMQEEDKSFEVKSPMVGTFYRASSPDAKPYIKEGNFVRKGQVLCIIEAMKLMNEIEAERDGRVLKIVPQNAQPVEYNQTLFIMSEEQF